MTPVAPSIRDASPLIKAEVDKARRILLHCHPSPDPDSVGSVLAMKGVLESLGKTVVAIKGDSPIPAGFMHFPGSDSIEPKNFFEVDLSAFDLFIALDAANVEQISRFKPISLPLPIRTVVIDHHRTNPGYGDVNLIESAYPAVGQILYDLFTTWGVTLSPETALNLFMAIYTDTGGFKYQGTTPRSFEIAAELARLAPSFPQTISEMENSDSPKAMYFRGLALSSIRTFLGGRLALSIVPYTKIAEQGFAPSDVRAGDISAIMRSVKDWDVAGVVFEAEPGKLRVSFRSHDAYRFNVADLAESLGGGGHRAAAGAVMQGSPEAAAETIVANAQKLFAL